MKKNLMMRAASVLLVAVMLTTCAISGTFAKYVTTGHAEASARVAKFGVNIAASGNLFRDAYINEPSADDPSSTVLSYNSTDTLVAPGTQNTTGLSLSVTGTPEVDVKVDITVDGAAIKDVYLGDGTYNDMTTGTIAGDEFTLGDDYYPIVYTLTQTKTGGTEVTTGTLAQIVAKLNTISTATYTANTNLADVVGTLTLTWKWAYQGEQTLNSVNFTATQVDQADTYLGDLAAGTASTKQADGVTPVDYNLSTMFNFTITVTQVD